MQERELRGQVGIACGIRVEFPGRDLFVQCGLRTRQVWLDCTDLAFEPEHPTIGNAERRAVPDRILRQGIHPGPCSFDLAVVRRDVPIACDQATRPLIILGSEGIAYGFGDLPLLFAPFGGA